MEHAYMFIELNEEDMGDATAGLCFGRWCQHLYETGRIMDERAHQVVQKSVGDIRKRHNRIKNMLCRLLNRKK